MPIRPLASLRAIPQVSPTLYFTISRML